MAVASAVAPTTTAETLGLPSEPCGWILVGLVGCCVHATGVFSLLMVLLSSSTLMLVWLHSGGGVRGRWVLVGGTVVVPWVVSGFSQWRCRGSGGMLASAIGGECATGVVFRTKISMVG
jgi:hypothetical protein